MNQLTDDEIETIVDFMLEFFEPFNVPNFRNEMIAKLKDLRRKANGLRSDD